MGLLSDPSLTPRSKLALNLSKHQRKLCGLLYFAGVVWFCVIAHSEFNYSTYLSENALSPGLVYAEIKHDSSRLANLYIEELKRERETHKSTTPYAWIIAKMKQIGLETHVHNFTLRYPFAGGKEYYGKNIYGILRAPRTSSTEGIVFSAPYRPPSSIHTDIVASVPVLLAFAEFARKKNYWAKDIIFLVTEQEQLGAHAWLTAYHEGNIRDSEILKSGTLPARAGVLQAALNLEIQDIDIDYIDIKIEGLNSQLPNLDLFNLVQRYTTREGFSSGYKQTPRKKRRVLKASLENNLRNMMEMLASQATGVPNGNHGLFHRYRVEALTIEAVKRSSGSNANRNVVASPLLTTIEGISRSLNNLLERFHQSYFFYILVQNDRFVSIGDFMPCLMLLAGSMFIKAFLLWLSTNTNVNGDNDNEESEKKITNTETNRPYGEVILFIAVSALFGFLSNFLPQNQAVHNYFMHYGWGTSTTISFLLLGITIVSFIFPFIVNVTENGRILLHVGVLVFLGVALIAVGLLNFALGFFVALISVPLAITISNKYEKSGTKLFTILLTILINPFLIIFGIIFVLTMYQYPELAFNEIFMRAINVTADGITFGLMDHMIYGNWLFTIITAVFFPIWVLFWLFVASRRNYISEIKIKTN